MVLPLWKIFPIIAFIVVVVCFAFTAGFISVDVAVSSTSSTSTSASTDFGVELGAGDYAAIAVGVSSPGPSNSIVTADVVQVQGNAVRRIMMRSQSFTASAPAPAGNTKTTSPIADDLQNMFSWLNRKFPWLKTVVPILLGSAFSITVTCRCYFSPQRRHQTRVRPESNADSTTEFIDVELGLNGGTQEGVGQASS